MAAGVPCQDAYAYRIEKDGTWAAAVADGAGSARYAAAASEIAVKTAVGYLSLCLALNKPDTPDRCRRILSECVAHVRLCLKERSSARNKDSPTETSLNDFATTLLVVFMSDSFFGAAQIGDGAIVYRDGSGGLTVACKPEQGEYLNETFFITSEDFDRHCQLAIADSRVVDAVSMFSDGLQMLALNYKDFSAHGPFFNPLFQYAGRQAADPEELRQLLVSERICEHSDDDKTIVLAVRSTCSQR